MAKVKSKWICQTCGYETSGYLGKCPDCSSWGTLVEETYSKTPIREASSMADSRNSAPQLLKDISLDESIRYTTGILEFDTVLGGGLVMGSLVLVGGDPGIGKSTITLQSCGNLAKNGLKTLYVSAEESAKQIKLRAERLNVDSENLYIFAENNIEEIQKNLTELKPEILIIDSIQAVYNPAITSSPGSVSQVSECCGILMHIAKSRGITVLVIGHVTKDGAIAGPKVLEHMVDTVLYFEGDRYKSYRLLRSIKNRFGSTNEVGVFNMEEGGLVEVSNPSELFLSERSNAIAPGSVVIASSEGTRPILVEIQALVGPTSYPSPRRVTTGIEYNRVLQILAVLEKRVGLNLSKQDVYVNAVGGIDIQEPAADLGIALAVATCARNVTVDPETVIIGEIGLSGEIRSVSNLESKINEAYKLGFKKVLVPKSNLPLKNISHNLEIIGVSRLLEAITSSISVASNK
ncbi:MAG: DNA repair protein RadA [Candidatus Melainabacteria bacterium GWF2_32_7]|nr:MAG: DNA repair protein RadA [Candidatus Melainabacteria bacterium GWF2_32_7]